MWRTSLLTCRGVFLAVLCGSAIPAGAGILGFQAIEPPTSARPGTEQLSLDATKIVGYVSFPFPNEFAAEIIVPHALTTSLTRVYKDGAVFLGSLAAILRGPGASLTPLAVAPDLWGGHDPLSDFNADFPAGATLGRSDAFACPVNPAECLQTGCPPGSSFDDLLPALHMGTDDPTAGVRALPVGIEGRQLTGAGGGQTDDEFVRRAPVPGALFLAVFGLGVAGLSWRRFV